MNGTKVNIHSLGYLSKWSSNAPTYTATTMCNTCTIKSDTTQHKYTHKHVAIKDKGWDTS